MKSHNYIITIIINAWIDNSTDMSRGLAQYVRRTYINYKETYKLIQLVKFDKNSWGKDSIVTDCYSR